MTITGEHLKIARIVYGYSSQEQLADELGVSLATVQRYEALEEVDAKVLQKYRVFLHFNLPKLVQYINDVRHKRNIGLTMALRM